MSSSLALSHCTELVLCHLQYYACAFQGQTFKAQPRTGGCPQWTSGLHVLFFLVALSVCELYQFFVAECEAVSSLWFKSEEGIFYTNKLEVSSCHKCRSLKLLFSGHIGDVQQVVNPKFNLFIYFKMCILWLLKLCIKKQPMPCLAM